MTLHDTRRKQVKIRFLALHLFYTYIKLLLKGLDETVKWPYGGSDGYFELLLMSIKVAFLNESNPCSCLTPENTWPTVAVKRSWLTCVL